jgi:acyl-coenzyme A thioesterase PaaI-like protein
MSREPAEAADHPQRSGAEVPAATTFGVGATRPCSGGVELTLVRRPEAVDGEGALPTGVLALAVDHALGGAIAQVISDDEVMITSHLHLELVRPLTPDVDAVVAHGEVVEKGGGHAFTRGVMRDGDGRILALMTARFAMLPLDSSAGGYVRPGGAAAPVPTGQEIDDVHVDEPPVSRLLRMRVVEETPGRIVTRFRAHGGLANERQGVHGGVGVLVGERALDRLVRTIGDGSRFRPVELRAVFLRPLAADGSDLVCDAEVGYAGRSVITGRATLSTPGGKAAVVVDAIHAVDRP